MLDSEKGVRLRGLETTRLDTFVDAAFAFVLTLLVISFDDIPSNREELLQALKSVPAFAASFAALMTFWLSHRVWSRRYGLENPATLRLTLALIFVVLVYVYPLRAIFEAMFAAITDDFLPSSFRIGDILTLRTLFAFYSVGFLLMCLIMRQLYAAALRNAAALALDTDERLATLGDIAGWSYSALFAVISILIATLTPDGPWIPLAGYIYFVMLLGRPLALRWLSRGHRRRFSRGEAPAASESAE